jgi:hypothetical protein
MQWLKNMKLLKRWLILLSISSYVINTYSQESPMSDCETTLQSCNAAFEESALLVEQLQTNALVCNDIVETQRQLIEEDAARIKTLVPEAEHSHIPIVAATSGFWILFFKFLPLLAL